MHFVAFFVFWGTILTSQNGVSTWDIFCCRLASNGSSPSSFPLASIIPFVVIYICSYCLTHSSFISVCSSISELLDRPARHVLDNHVLFLVNHRLCLFYICHRESGTAGERGCDSAKINANHSWRLTHSLIPIQFGCIDRQNRVQSSVQLYIVSPLPALTHARASDPNGGRARAHVYWTQRMAETTYNVTIPHTSPQIQYASDNTGIWTHCPFQTDLQICSGTTQPDGYHFTNVSGTFFKLYFWGRLVLAVFFFSQFKVVEPGCVGKSIYIYGDAGKALNLSFEF